MSEEQPNGLRTLYVRDTDELEDVIDRTRVSTVVEVTFSRRSGEAPVKQVGYYVSVGPAYSGSSIFRAIRIKPSTDSEKTLQIPLDLICSFAAYDKKTPYTVQQPDLPPRRKGRINLKSEFL